MDQFSGGNWPMIPNVQLQGNFGTPTNQDHLFFQHQQQQPPQFHHQQTQQFQSQQQDLQFQQFQQQQQQFIQPHFHQQQRMLQSPQSQTQQSMQSPPPQTQMVQTPQSMMQTPQQSVQTPQQHQSLASHFHLYPLVEKLSDVIETGTRDQNSDALVTELNNHFEKCQQLLNSISGSLGSKTMTVDGQKRKLEETEQLLQQRRELIGEYRKSIEELVKIEP